MGHLSSPDPAPIPPSDRTTLNPPLAGPNDAELVSEAIGEDDVVGLWYRVGEICSVERARADNGRLVPELPLHFASRKTEWQIASGRKAKVLEV